MSNEINMSELVEKVDSILKNAEIPERHTFFQIEKFIIGKEPTSHAQIWQIIKEMDARMSSIDNFKKELEDAEDNLELLDVKIERSNLAIKLLSKKEDEFSALDIREHEITIRKLLREKSSLIEASRQVRKKLKSVLEELSFLAMGYDKIAAKLDEIKPWDDDQAQSEMWNEKLLEEFNLRVILQRPLDIEFIRTVLCLDDNSPVKKHTVRMIENIQNKMLIQNKPEPPKVEVKPRTQG